MATQELEMNKEINIITPINVEISKESIIEIEYDMILSLFTKSQKNSIIQTVYEFISKINPNLLIKSKII